MTQTVPGAARGRAEAGRSQRWRLRRGELLARAGWWYTALPRRRLDVLQDSALGVGLAIFNMLSLLPYLSQLHPSWLAILLVVGQCLPLALRRVSPLASLIGCGLIRNVYDGLAFGFAPLPLGPAIAFATVAERSGPAVRWLSVAGTAGGIAWGQVQPGHTEPYDGVIQVFFFAAAWTVGTLSRYRRAALDAASSRAAQAEAALAETASQAAAAERLRIARELHDVVAHHVSLVAVQAEAVGALLPGRPEAASASADLIGATARAAMTELRRLLGVLRFTGNPEPAPAQLGPAPSLSRLSEVIDAAREAGLAVTCEVSGTPGPLPPGVDLTGYRILQEALTNAVRHAPGADAAVRVGYAPGELLVEVSNTGPPPGPPRPAAPRLEGHGYGLAGIAERVASCGGSLTLGPACDGGFTVSARLPRA